MFIIFICIKLFHTVSVAKVFNEVIQELQTVYNTVIMLVHICGCCAVLLRINYAIEI